MTNQTKFLWLLGALLWFMPTTYAQDLKAFEKRVTEFTLDNGLRVIVVKRDVAPVASFVTVINAGSANDPKGYGGIAHIFEHMAFKGDDQIGTKDYKTELEAIGKVETAYRAWYEARAAGKDSAMVNGLWRAFKAADKVADGFVVSNEFSQIVDRNGGQGMNASTYADFTNYYYSLPANKAELWFALEAARFRKPIFREFYKEKDVVKEERRMRVDSNPIGRLVEKFLGTAFIEHPYGRPGIGSMEDIERTKISDARAFYEKYYVASNMTIVAVGDLDPVKIKQYAQTYFGDYPKRPKPDTGLPLEPEQKEERRTALEEQSQPFLLMGYKIPSMSHADMPALEVLSAALTGGSTARFYDRLVKKEQKAAAIQGLMGFPGEKYPNLIGFFAVPTPDASLETLETLLNEEIVRVQREGITQAELDRIRTKQRANTIRSLGNNMGIALQFADYQMKTGDWRNFFKDVELLDKLTIADIKRVANQYLQPANRTLVSIKTKAKS